MSLSAEEREALKAVVTLYEEREASPLPDDEAIWIAAKRFGIEQAAKLANDFDFGLDSQAGLVKDIRALKDKHGG